MSVNRHDIIPIRNIFVLFAPSRPSREPKNLYSLRANRKARPDLVPRIDGCAPFTSGYKRRRVQASSISSR
jgi:hypothetical protein